jgi:hypothetical protein
MRQTHALSPVTGPPSSPVTGRLHPGNRHFIPVKLPSEPATASALVISLAALERESTATVLAYRLVQHLAAARHGSPASGVRRESPR